MDTRKREPRPELDAILDRLKRGDLAALDKVTRENVVALIDRAEGDDLLVGLLNRKL
jgi:hypothetical protein